MTITECYDAIQRIYERWAEANHYDLGFDAGEFTSSACDRAADKEARALLRENGYTWEDYVAEEIRQSEDHWTKVSHELTVQGENVPQQMEDPILPRPELEQRRGPLGDMRDVPTFHEPPKDPPKYDYRNSIGDIPF